jgi:dCTP deaminase
MSALSDISINALCSVFPLDMQHSPTEHVVHGSGMIRPYINHSVKTEKREAVGDNANVAVFSYGLSSYGYDVRLADELEIFSAINNISGDAKRPSKGNKVKANILTDEYGGRFAWLPAGGFMLGHTVEYFRIPRDIIVICLGKSSYAREGIIVNVTPLEPEWEGNVVIEISNTSGVPQKIYVDEGISQFVFIKGDEPCHTSYKDRGGKYQGQRGITHGKV